jgi:hypothetical protein
VRGWGRRGLVLHRLLHRFLKFRFMDLVNLFRLRLFLRHSLRRVRFALNRYGTAANACGNVHLACLQKFDSAGGNNSGDFVRAVYGAVGYRSR